MPFKNPSCGHGVYLLNWGKRNRRTVMNIETGEILSEGWYCYDGHAVSGPFRLGELQGKLSESMPVGTNGLYIARPGFERWLAWEEFHLRFKPVEDFDTQIAQQTKTLKEVILASTSLETTPVSVSVDEPTPNLRESAPVHEAKPAPGELLNLWEIKDQNLNYLVLRGRLRLGELRKFYHLATLSVLSLGFFTNIWIRWAYCELNWHLSNEASVKGLYQSWLAFVPILSLPVFARLAQLIQQAEKQDGVSRTSVTMAGFLSIVPPLAMFYLQRQMNSHWQRHLYFPIQNEEKIFSNTSSL